MITTRIIPCLDCRSGRVVKGVKFSNLRDSGDPVELATRYEAEGADELVLLDISATIEARYAQLHTIEQVRRALSIPLTVGGGVQDEADEGRPARLRLLSLREVHASRASPHSREGE